LPRPNRRQEIYAYVRERLLRGDAPPTVREIQAALGYRSPSVVHAYLKQLEAAGLIRRSRHRSRGITVTDGPLGGLHRIPLLGRVPAGPPALATEVWDETFALPAGWATSDAFALRVRGDSMTGAGILDGDVVVVARDLPIRDGDIVVALIGDEATVKRYYREADAVRLEPANPAYPPIRSSEALLLGRVTTLLRRY
jgi:repressor LexA